MSVSDIAVTALTAVATVKGNALTITTSDPRSGALPNIALDHVDIYASQTDTFASSSVVTQGTLRALHANAGEGQAWFYWGIPYDKLGAAGTRYPSGATGGVACTSLDQVGLAFGLSNGKLVASVAANALTIAIKTAAGNDPSASDPVFIAFRNATLATGNYVIRTLTAALSLVISSGSTLGTVNSIPFRIWIVAIDDGGTVRLAVTNCYDGTTLWPLPLAEYALISALSEGGAGGADSTSSFYASQAVTSKPFRIIGYVEWSSGLATVGTWSSGPDGIQMYGPGIRLPGQTVQEIELQDRAHSFGAATVPYDDTPPLDSEVLQFSAASITPTSKINLIENEMRAPCSNTVAGRLVLALHKSGTSTALEVSPDRIANADDLVTMYLIDRRQAGSTAFTTFNWGGGCDAGGTFHVNGISTGRKYGGALSLYKRCAEIMV